MSEACIVTRFIAYFPGVGADGQEELAHVERALGGEDLHVLRRGGYLLAIAAVNSPGAGRPPDWFLDVFPGTAASARLSAAGAQRLRTMDDLHECAETSAQCYNLLQASEDAFAMESDALGLKPAYTARTAGGFVLASRIADLLRVFPTLARPADVTAMCEMLVFWGPLVGRTLYRSIRRTLPGGCYRWSRAGGFSASRGRDLHPVTIQPGWLVDEAIASIHDEAERSLREKVGGAAQPLLLALSGGYDSRFIAALCREQHIRVRAVTYGRRHHSEMRSTHAVARSVGLDLQVLPQLADGLLHYLSQCLDTTEGTADPGATSVLNLLRADAPRGTSLLHGFAGDVQAGIRVCDYSAAEYASRESMVDAIMRRNYPSRRNALFGLFQPPADADEIRQDVHDGLRDDCSPHAAYELWYLENRTRRYVATHFSMLSQHFDVVMPFFDRRLFQLWHSIPPAALADRALFKRMLAHYYPKLARIGHPEELVPAIPNLRWQLGSFRHKLPSRLLAACVGGPRADELMLRMHRHRNFRTLSKMEAPQQRAYMLSRVAGLQHALREVLGVTLSVGYETVLARDNQALRTMFGIACYAARRADAECRTDPGGASPTA